ncbi:glycosyltransferase [Actinomadura sp. HBU206391]|uniref:glycosyltransferase n=1 Tax=Actinomadura sp. HBU206391 TaxID=2731692 RepID=UPI0016508DD4|nr:glycosyltransferase [Actinomadura sp. HBU206391]MBC6458990.1 glycosyltransferase [Actinomadura sp. HBU206391]
MAVGTANVLSHHVGWYGLAVGSIVLAKLVMSIPFGRRKPPSWGPATPTLEVAAVVTAYNEDPSVLRSCLDSFIGQTRRPDSITVVDDGSDSPDAAELAESMAPYFRDLGVRFEVIRFTENRGKREGLAAGFAANWDADVYLCVDSDTVLEREATERALQPFASGKVMCVTGLVLALNRSVNLLTRLIDMRYVNAFLGDRVAYSRLGSVLCACGSMALYRGWVVRRYLDDFLTQTWLGAPATAGDDRRLTFYCLLEGRTVIQPQAVAWTAVPERISHYLRQQARWTKSFIREGLLMTRTSPGRVCWWLNLVELVTWVAFTSALIVGVATVTIQPHWWAAGVGYIVYVCAASWVRSLHYLRGAAAVPPLDRVLTFLAAPLYALMNLTLLIPLRLYALATMRDSRWGTRAYVEVASQGNGCAMTVPLVPRRDVLVAAPSVSGDEHAGGSADR